MRFIVGGWLARTFQKLLIQSVFLVAMMSSKTARTSGVAVSYSTLFTIAMASSSPESDQ
jgi:hypothetical protein